MEQIMFGGQVGNQRESKTAARVKLQRSVGLAKVGFAQNGLETLYQSGCAKIMLPKSYCAIPEAIIVNTGGGLTGGDKFHIHATVKAGANLCVSSQTAERIYRSVGGQAKVLNSIKMGAGCSLEWLPQETILFEGSALNRKFEARLEMDSCLLALETLVLGRAEMGEVLTSVNFNDQWRIWRDGKIIYGDGLRIDAQALDKLSQPAVFGANRALAVLLYVAPDATERLAEAKSLLRELNVETAISAWNGMIVVRFISEEANMIRSAIKKYLLGFRGRDLPRVWHM
ncbi:MAG: urease accessory protein UreD [Devosiaceae bacterium]|nr:urease accessory protein UreD [Devosiaceae bacterium]